MSLRSRCANVFGKYYRGIVSPTIRKRTFYSSLVIPVGQSIKYRFVVQCHKSNARSSDSIIGSKQLYYDNTKNERNRNFILAIAYSIYRWIRITLRLLRLIIWYGPLLITYPLVRRNEALMRRWMSYALYLVEKGGPAIIKFAQWASTRRDLFSKEFCDLFSQLYTSTSQHKWKRTENALKEALGEKWRSYFMDLDERNCGSGCVAQVHKARLNYIAIQRAPTEIRSQFEICEKPWIDVAIKVTHRGVKRAIADDLTIISGLVKILKWLKPNWKFVDPEKCLDEFRNALIRQIDMRYEGDALRLFSKQFENDKTIHFPRPLFQTEDVLIETFEEGQHLSNYLNHSDTELKRRLAKVGMDALLKMIFVHNFVHGDLHPGNILVQEYDDAVPRRGMHKRWADFWRKLGSSDVSGLVSSDDYMVERRTRLVFLDVGISVRLSERDLANLRAVFKAVVEGDGRHAGELLLRYSPQQRCPDSGAFVDEIDKLVTRARANSVTLGTMNVSTLLSDLLSTVSHHRVNLEPNFTCVVLAVLVLEGLGRSLDPELDLLKVARPVLLRV